MMKVILASSNSKKLKELADLLSSSIELVSQSSLDIISPPETGLTFVENALIKARHACASSGLPSIADDSGLEVAELNGAPGIYSSRYAGEDATDADNVSKLLKEMEGKDKRLARFVCVMVYLRHASDPVPLIAEGIWEGEILEKPEGANGFGYDPVFFIPEQNCTSAQLESAVKNQLSHRARAVEQLKTLLSANISGYAEKV